MKIRHIVATFAVAAFANATIAANAQVNNPVDAQDRYILGSNDEIEVTLFRQPQNTVTRTKIKEDGTVNLPYIGQITAKGLTARQLSAEVVKDLTAGGYFVKPIVSIDVTQFVSNSVTVTGEASTPGIYPLDHHQTIAMILARAGGVRADGADFVVLRRQNDPEAHNVLLADMTGPWSGATEMVPGDVLYVPSTPIVYVYGQVNAPGQVAIKTGMTVRQALARAGGPTLAGSEHKLSLYRNGKRSNKLDLESLVQPGDTIFVHERLL